MRQIPKPVTIGRSIERGGRVIIEEFGIVAQHGDAAHQREHVRQSTDRLAAGLDLAFGRIAVAADLIGRIRRHDGGHHHFHQGQRSGLVRADARDGPQRFDRRQTADDRVALGDALHADGERYRDQRGQTFRDHRRRDADNCLE